MLHCIHKEDSKYYQDNIIKSYAGLLELTEP